MHAQPSGGCRVSTCIEAPIFFAIPSSSSLVKGEVSFNPGDPFEPVTMRGDNGPEVTMLPLGQRLGLQYKLKTVGHIPAVRQNMHTAWGPDQRLDRRGHLRALGSLPGPADRPFRTEDGVIREYAPASAGPAWSVATPPNGGNLIHNVMEGHRVEDGVLSHLLTGRAKEIPLGYVAGVSQGIGAIKQQGRSAGE